MKISEVADRRHCELCGATIIEGQTDPVHNCDGLEVLRALAYLADEAPDLAIALMHYIVGRTEREIAAKMGVAKTTVHDRLQVAKRKLTSIKKYIKVQRKHLPHS